MRSRAAFAALSLLLATACSATKDDSSAQPAGGDASISDSSSGGDGASFDVSVDDTGTPTAVAHLHGKVVAPEGTIPISGALVYLTHEPPPAIPDGVFCDRCVKLSSSTPYTTTNPDGTFDLPAYATGKQLLVVQKGAFRRVREIDVQPGDQPVPAAFTTLPGRTDDANGDHIPKMAVVVGAWDSIEVALAKLGLGKFSGNKLDKSSLAFDLYEATWPPGGATSPEKILKDPAVLSKYQILFIPCQGSDGTTCNDYRSLDKTIQKNLQDWVAAGGRLYVTDYAYDFVRQPWPGYVDWKNQTSEVGSACLPGSYDAPAVVDDPGMQAWLAAQGVTSFTLKESWTQITKVNEVATTDLDGNPTKVTPKVWVSAGLGSGPAPATVSFERACGRVLFSTYHVEAKLSSDPKELLPQEKALLYVLLEVAVCVGPDVIK